MGKGGKILLGCGIAVVLAGGAVAVALVVGGMWVKNKAEKYVGDAAAKAQEISRYQAQANRNTFTEPADGVLQEARLVKYLDVRKKVFDVYLQHKPDFDSLSERTKDKKDLSISETMEGAALMTRLITDIKLVQLKALADEGMSESEYAFVTQAVYKSAWAGEYQKGQGEGHQPAQDLEKAADEMKKNVPGADTAIEQFKNQARQLQVPQANVDLFKKYESDIKKYAMTGLAAVGL